MGHFPLLLPHFCYFLRPSTHSFRPKPLPFRTRRPSLIYAWLHPHLTHFGGNRYVFAPLTGPFMRLAAALSHFSPIFRSHLSPHTSLNSSMFSLPSDFIWRHKVNFRALAGAIFGFDQRPYSFLTIQYSRISSTTFPIL